MNIEDLNSRIEKSEKSSPVILVPMGGYSPTQDDFVRDLRDMTELYGIDVEQDVLSVLTSCTGRMEGDREVIERIVEFRDEQTAALFFQSIRRDMLSKYEAILPNVPVGLAAIFK